MDYKKLQSATEREQWEIASSLMQQHGADVVNYLLDLGQEAMARHDTQTMEALEAIGNKIDEINGHADDMPQNLLTSNPC